MVETACQHDRIWDIIRGDPSKVKGEDGYVSPTAITRRLQFIPDWWQKGFSLTLQAWGSRAHFRQVPRNGHLAPQGTGQLAPHKLPALHAQIVRLTGGMACHGHHQGYLAWRGLKG